MSDIQPRQYGASPDNRLSTPPNEHVWWKVYPFNLNPFRFVERFAKTAYEATRKATAELGASQQDLKATMFSYEQSEIKSFEAWIDLGGE